MSDYEKLGAFYLGKTYDPERGETRDDLLLYDAKDLTTHAVCVGMTGSGKTGLCVSLLEEAAIDGIPALVIDPKGDLGNLLLSFPELQAGDFEPWIDEGEAARKGSTVSEFAVKTAKRWKDGLAAWDQEPSRIARFRDAVDVSIYTPGSAAGLPLTILRSFSAPSPELLKDEDALRDRIAASVSGLLALLGVDADPLQSREHILLSNILDRAWRAGTHLELRDLIMQIQTPPFGKLGMMDLESFYPQKDRFALSLRLNNILASPGFRSWMEGDPLDIQRLLYTSAGKPRISILSVAHLSDAERMFFVTLVLNEVVSWMRTQPGTSSLRALLYMDEIFGYFPPSANPPSKLPMLTLLKQARAFGLGCVLATQNPVDLDYKGLSNTGTWFIGRLQTERDKLRVLDGLEGAGSSAGKSFDRKRMERILSGLGNRVFLMNNVHEDEPVLFQTRWTLSYLRGPLTRSQIERLMAERKAQRAQAPVPVAVAIAREPSLASSGTASTQNLERPVLPSAVNQVYFRPQKDPREGARVMYRPLLMASLKLHYALARVQVDQWNSLTLLAPIPESGDLVPWDEASLFRDRSPETDRKPFAKAEFARLMPAAAQAKSYVTWGREVKSFAYQNRAMQLWKCAALKLTSHPDETEGDFRVRVAQAAREQRDIQMEKLRARYAPKVVSAQERIRKAEARVEQQKTKLSQRTLQTLVSIGSTLAGALLGRKMSMTTLSKAGTAINRAGSTASAKGDINRAEETLESLQESLVNLEQDFEAALEEMKRSYEPENLELKETLIRPRKSDITVSRIALAWTPWQVDVDGIAEPLFERGNGDDPVV